MATNLKNAFKDESLTRTTEGITDSLDTTYETCAETVEELEGKHGLRMEWRDKPDKEAALKVVEFKRIAK